MLFLNGGVASVTISTAHGQTVEVATVGVEGVVGIDAFFGAPVGITETMMQVPDTSAESMLATDFRAEMQQRGALYEGVTCYAQAFLGLVMQSTACMAFHSAQERCCRWLLMAHDRVGRDQFEVAGGIAARHVVDDETRECTTPLENSPRSYVSAVPLSSTRCAIACAARVCAWCSNSVRSSAVAGHAHDRPHARQSHGTDRG